MKRMLLKLTLIAIPAACLLLASDAPIEQVQTSHTEHMDFPSGGTLIMKKSTGDLTIEGWDGSGLEITTVRSTKSYHPEDRAAIAAYIASLPPRQGPTPPPKKKN